MRAAAQGATVFTVLSASGNPRLHRPGERVSPYDILDGPRSRFPDRKRARATRYRAARLVPTPVSCSAAKCSAESTSPCLNSSASASNRKPSPRALAARPCLWRAGWSAGGGDGNAGAHP